MDGEGSSTNFKRKILQKVKDLTNHGKHKEASELFKIYFPNFGEYTNGKKTVYTKAVLKHRWCPGGKDGWGRIFD